MSESKRNVVPTERDHGLAENVNLAMDRLGKKSRSLRRVQAVQNNMFSKLEKKYDKRLKNKVKELRPGRIFAEDYSVISQSAENAKWYEEGAKIDLQTGLLTKIGLKDKLETVYAEIKRGVIKRAVILEFDLNGFKAINESYTHAAGDRAIKIFAEALQGMDRNRVDTACRKQAGGDEFYLLLELGNQDQDIDKIKEIVVTRIFDRVSTLMRSENFKWEVLDENNIPVLNKTDNPMYAATGIEVLDKGTIGQMSVDQAFSSLEQQYKSEKKKMNLKKRF
jgi:diguanylate cyclase (GGDEF)-like protein